jgi:hypothetical protein
MNYKENAVSGTVWQRAHDINISNQYNQVPVITFYEEEMMEANGTTYQKEIGNIRESMTDPYAAFPLINPNDGTTIGTAHYYELQIMLFSLYLHLAGLRDNPPA